MVSEIVISLVAVLVASLVIVLTTLVMPARRGCEAFGLVWCASLVVCPDNPML